MVIILSPSDEVLYNTRRSPIHDSLEFALNLLSCPVRIGNLRNYGIYPL